MSDTFLDEKRLLALRNRVNGISDGRVYATVEYILALENARNLHRIANALEGLLQLNIDKGLT